MSDFGFGAMGEGIRGVRFRRDHGASGGGGAQEPQRKLPPNLVRNAIDRYVGDGHERDEALRLAFRDAVEYLTRTPKPDEARAHRLALRSLVDNINKIHATYGEQPSETGLQTAIRVLASEMGQDRAESIARDAGYTF